jgi:small basic protein
METTPKISLRLLIWILIWFLLLGVGLTVFGNWALRGFETALSTYEVQALNPETLARIKVVLEKFAMVFVQGMAGGIVLAALLAWLCSRFAVNRAIKRALPAPSAPKERTAPKPTAAIETRMGDEARGGALHVLSLFQREGRFVDFLKEDLTAYDDAQIGAAVRSIHEGCRKALDKHFGPQPVLDRDEGEEVSIPAGFDPHAIRLTGNVSGEPPFKGVLQHKGWRAARVELPSLSGSQDPRIIAQAEVEIP